MGHTSIVYGRINGATWYTEDYFRLHRLNEKAIQDLPEHDSHHLLNRSMFSTTNRQGVYRSQIIHFGASYNGLEYGWETWIEKFEDLLRKMYWWDVKVHAEFELVGKHNYSYEIDLSARENTWFLENPKPILEWKFSSDGPRSFGDWL